MPESCAPGRVCFHVCLLFLVLVVAVFVILCYYKIFDQFLYQKLNPAVINWKM